MTETTIGKGKKVNTYSGNIRPALIIMLVIVVIHVAIASVITNEIDMAFWFVNGALFILYNLIFIVMVFQATQIKITIYENGIDWQRGGSHVFTTWDNIEAIGSKNEGDSTTYGLYLYKAIQPEVEDWLSQQFFSAPVDYIRLIPTVNVPTRLNGVQGNMIDMQALAEIDFGQDVLRYAPRLIAQ